MIEFGKYGIYVISAYGVTILTITALSLYTFVDYKKTKKKLTRISKKP